MLEVLPPLRMELEVHGQRCSDLMISAGGDAVVSPASLVGGAG